MLRTKHTATSFREAGPWACLQEVRRSTVHVEGRAQSFLRGLGSLDPSGWERILDAAREAWNAKAVTSVLLEGMQPAGLN